MLKCVFIVVFSAVVNWGCHSGSGNADAGETEDVQEVTNTLVGIKIQLNLPSYSVVPGNSPFNPADSFSFNISTSTDVCDADGNHHTLGFYFAKESSSTWRIYSTLDGMQVNLMPETDGDIDSKADSNGVYYYELHFDGAGENTNPAPYFNVDEYPLSSLETLTIQLDMATYRTTSYNAPLGVYVIDVEPSCR